jgi:predicted amidophosphoribosyltransferase
VYEERARRVVSGWKEAGRRGIAAGAAALVVEVVARPEVDVLVPVPGDPERTRARGRSTTASLAAELGERWALPVAELLRRTRPLRRQRELPLAERRRNVRGSVTAVRAAPQRVCVVDDVYTTGATADACAAALRKAGAGYVEIVTLARAVR